MDWLEYNIHTHITYLELYKNGVLRVAEILTDLLEPFVREYGNRLTHWHYLIEPAVCRGPITIQSPVEIRIRFEGERPNLDEIRRDLVSDLAGYCDRTHPTMREDELLGSHERRHGQRGQTYRGAEPEEDLKEDWPSVVEILQIGSESALKILRIGKKLESAKALAWEPRLVEHWYYLHLPAKVGV